MVRHADAAPRVASHPFHPHGGQIWALLLLDCNVEGGGGRGKMGGHPLGFSCVGHSDDKQRVTRGGKWEGAKLEGASGIRRGGLT